MNARASAGAIQRRRVDADPTLVYKIASEPCEFEQIHHLNYRTFVEEIPQHPANDSGLLQDRYHDQNTYFICLRGSELIGMISISDQRPFSLDKKLPRLDDFLPAGRKSICEIRLLSIQRRDRGGQILRRLVQMVAERVIAGGYNLVIFSATVRQLKLYRHLGAVPFGPEVGTEGASYQPMYILPEKFVIAHPVNFLPGPVAVPEAVERAFFEAPVSHRSAEFHRLLAETKTLLKKLVHAGQVEVFVGSGTLANDIVAGQLTLLRRPGVILSNGEFGDRLIDHAGRWKIDCEAVRIPWGAAYSEKTIERILDRHQDAAWVWAVHCETSTGVLNDLEMLQRICASRRIRLCLDCVSSIGTVPVDLRGVYLASGASGKAICGYPGLSMVYFNHKIAPRPRDLPRYLDLGYAAANDGVPFTHSSNLVSALHAALLDFRPDFAYTRVARLSQCLRASLEQSGHEIVAPSSIASPAVITIRLPAEDDSRRIGVRLRDQGILVGFESVYLVERNWIQIYLTRYTKSSAVERFVHALRF